MIRILLHRVVRSIRLPAGGHLGGSDQAIMDAIDLLDERLSELRRELGPVR